jgi:hypothetical protein
VDCARAIASRQSKYETRLCIADEIGEKICDAENIFLDEEYFPDASKESASEISEIGQKNKKCRCVVRAAAFAKMS